MTGAFNCPCGYSTNHWKDYRRHVRDSQHVITNAKNYQETNELHEAAELARRQKEATK